jgi:hypothetical protein
MERQATLLCRCQPLVQIYTVMDTHHTEQQLTNMLPTAH